MRWKRRIAACEANGLMREDGREVVLATRDKRAGAGQGLPAADAERTV